MCELLGMSANIVTNLEFSLQSLEAHSINHKDGWGVAFYPSGCKRCEIIKEPEQMSNSEKFKGMSLGTISSKIILSHIRQATTEKSLQNTHPFYRKLFGEDWVLIHNGGGGITDYYKEYQKEKDLDLFFKPKGSTGSERALCIIMNELKRELSQEDSQDTKTGYSFDQAQRIIHETCISLKDNKAQLNLIMSNGTYLIAFHSGYNKLHYVERENYDEARCRKIKMKDRDYKRVGLIKGEDEIATIIATKALTEGENWIQFKPGETRIVL